MSFNNANMIRQQAQRIEKELQGMVTVMGNEALNFFKKSFTDQGFTDESLQPWAQRKRPDRGRSAGQRGILIKTGDLRRSLRKIRSDKWSITIATDKPYAEIHNEGLQGKTRSGTAFQMPKRQFMGNSETLKRKLREKFDQRIRTVFHW